jgi:hypothetical protein
MTPDTLLTELQTRGIKVRRDGDRLLVTDPAHSLTPGLSAAIKKHKAALLDQLNTTPRDQLPLAAMSDDPAGDEPNPAQSAAVPSSPVTAVAQRTPIEMQIGDVRTERGNWPTLPDEEISLTLATGAPAALRVEVWPADQASRDRLSQLISDPRCVEYYAAGQALCEAIDREDEAAIVTAQARFDQALQAAQQLAIEVTA